MPKENRILKQTHVQLKPSVFYKTYSDCIKVNNLSHIIDVDIFHPNIETKPISHTYLGMGYYGVIIEDFKGFYHCIILGGSDDHERFHNNISFMFYPFNNPCGEVSKLNNTTNIIFHWLVMSKNTQKVYLQITINNPEIVIEKKFYDKMKSMLLNY
jgi:hypothetical protein